MRSAFEFPERELLRLELIARKWTRQDLALAAGISRPAAGRCLNDGGLVKPDTVWKVIRALRTNPPPPEMADWLAARRATVLAQAS